MSAFFIILILIIMLWPLIARVLRPLFMSWLQRYMARKTEDYMRQAMGMPPRDKKRSKKDEAQGSPSGPERGRRRAYTRTGPIIPKEYAEDVDFVEIKEFSSTHIEEEGDDSGTEYDESQVSDAIWEEIGPDGSKKKKRKWM